MRQFEFRGNTHTLTEGQYHKLLNRFDEGFAEASPRPSVECYVIKRPCICDDFLSCRGCPVGDDMPGGCPRILAHVMGIDASIVDVVFALSRESVSWKPHQDVCARRLLRKVYKALRRLPYIEDKEASHGS